MVGGTRTKKGKERKMSSSRIQWLGGDILIGERRFCHGDNGAQEFYETIIASQGVLLGTPLACAITEVTLVTAKKSGSLMWTRDKLFAR